VSFLTLAVLIIAAMLLQRYTLAHCLDGLKYDIRSDRRLVECGESFHLTSSVENDKALPVFFLHLDETVPSSLQIAEHEKGIRFRRVRTIGTESSSSMEQVVYIMPHQRLKRTVEVSLPERGRYLLKGAQLTAGDLFGLQERTMTRTMAREIVVKPGKMEIAHLEQAFGGYLGEISVRRFIMPDPIDTVGFREYTGREPMRDISWKETLRRNRFMVKQYDFTAESRASLIADITGADKEGAEAVFSAARTICEMLEEKNIQFSFVTNAWILSASSVFGKVQDGTGPVHLNAVYECLGRACLDSTQTTEKMLRDTLKGKNDGRSYIYISADPMKQQDLLRYYEIETGQKIFAFNALRKERVL